jgi:hypothetical protein
LYLLFSKDTSQKALTVALDSAAYSLYLNDVDTHGDIHSLGSEQRSR